MGKLILIPTRLMEVQALKTFRRELRRYPELRVFAGLAALLVLVELTILVLLFWVL